MAESSSHFETEEEFRGRMREENKSVDSHPFYPGRERGLGDNSWRPSFTDKNYRDNVRSLLSGKVKMTNDKFFNKTYKETRGVLRHMIARLGDVTEVEMEKITKDCKIKSFTKNGEEYIRLDYKGEEVGNYNANRDVWYKKRPNFADGVKKEYETATFQGPIVKKLRQEQLDPTPRNVGVSSAYVQERLAVSHEISRIEFNRSIFSQSQLQSEVETKNISMQKTLEFYKTRVKQLEEEKNDEQEKSKARISELQSDLSIKNENERKYYMEKEDRRVREVVNRKMKEIEGYMEEIENLSSSFSQERKYKDNKIEELEASLQERTLEIDKQESDIKALNEEIEEYKSILENNASNEEYTKKLQELETKLNETKLDYSNEKKKWDDDLKNLKGLLGENDKKIRQALESVKNKIKKVKDENKKLKDESKKPPPVVKELEKEVKHLRTLNISEKQISDDLRQKNFDLEQENLNSKKAIDYYVRKVKDYVKKVEAGIEANESLEKEQEALVNEIKGLQNDIIGYRNKLTEKENEILKVSTSQKKYSEEIQKQKKEIDSLKKKITELNNKLAQKTAELAKKGETVVEFQKIKEGEEKRVKEYEEDIKEKDRIIKDLKNKEGKLANQVANLQNNIDEKVNLISFNEVKERQYNDLLERYNTLKEKSKKTESDKEQVEEELKETQRKLEELRPHIADPLTIQGYRNDINGLRNSLKNIEAERDHLAQQLDEMKKGYNQLIKEKSNIEKKYKKEIEEIEKRFDKNIKILNKRYEGKLTTVKELKALERLINSAIDGRFTIENRRKRIDDAKAKINQRIKSKETNVNDRYIYRLGLKILNQKIDLDNAVSNKSFETKEGRDALDDLNTSLTRWGRFKRFLSYYRGRITEGILFISEAVFGALTWISIKALKVAKVTYQAAGYVLSAAVKMASNPIIQTGLVGTSKAISATSGLAVWAAKHILETIVIVLAIGIYMIRKNEKYEKIAIAGFAGFSLYMTYALSQYSSYLPW